MGHGLGRRRRGVRELAAAVACGLVSLTGPAQAAELKGARLESTRSEAASECPDEEALARAVQGQLTEQLPASREPLLLAVSIDRDAGGFVAHIQVTGRKHGFRTLRTEGRNCDALADALALTLAMILDERAREAARAQHAAPPQPEIRPARPAGTTADAQPRLRSSGWFSFGGAAATWGVPQNLSWAAIAEVGLWRPPWSATMGGFWSPTRSMAHGAGTVSVRVVGGLAAGCYEPGVSQSALVFSLCLDAALGSLRGTGTGYDVDGEQSRLWVAVGGGPALHGEITRLLGWRLRATAAAPLWHDSFSVEGLPAAAYESHPLVAWISAHLSATIW